MQVPYRKPGRYTNSVPDPMITKDKFEDLTRKLERAKASQGPAAAEVARLAELGDFSENAEYQLAKGKLRGINNTILRLENQIHQAEIIAPRHNGTVELGSKVTVVGGDGKEKTFHILGSVETKPEQGVISHQSPIGSALIGCSVGETVTVKLANKEVSYTIQAIT
jgi:transcription elongation factor GreA